MRRKKLYHGTTSLFIPEIRSRGLLGGTAEYRADQSGRPILGRTGGRVFLASNPIQAAAHAEVAVEERGGGDPVVLEVVTNQPLYIDPQFAEHEHTYSERDRSTPNYYIRGRVPPSNIKSIRPAKYYYDKESF